MNLMDDVIGNRSPIPLRRNGVAIPCRALEDAAVDRVSDAEFAALGHHAIFEVRGVKVVIRGKFLHRLRAEGDIEAEMCWRQPIRDRLDEIARRKRAVANRANAGALNSGAEGIGEAES